MIVSVSEAVWPIFSVITVFSVAVPSNSLVMAVDAGLLKDFFVISPFTVVAAGGLYLPGISAGQTVGDGDIFIAADVFIIVGSRGRNRHHIAGNDTADSRLDSHCGSRRAVIDFCQGHRGPRHPHSS